MLTQINVHHLRNLDTLQLTLHPRFNFFYGPNGSGKTSILEAIHLLGSGYSFRTRENAPLIQHGQSALTVFAKTETQDHISIQKNLQGLTAVRLNQQSCQRSSELAHFLPCLVFYHDLFQIIDAGPSVRRSMLDWGVFHVKHTYHELWKAYRTALKQRNALLRQNAPSAHFLPWDTLLDELAVEIDRLREHYFKEWSIAFQTILGELTTSSCRIGYEKGWSKKDNKSLKTILAEQLEQDRHRQYTYSGPQHADIVFDAEVLKARQHLSRGQQKIMLIALKLAQAQLLTQPCLYLLDDITMELDAEHIERLFEKFVQLPGQFFLTSVQTLAAYEKMMGNTFKL